VRRKRLRTTTETVGFVKDWESIADNLSKSGMGRVSAIDREGRTIWIADAHRDDERRFVSARESSFWRSCFVGGLP